jgi:hypothetical protein
MLIIAIGFLLIATICIIARSKTIETKILSIEYYKEGFNEASMQEENKQKDFPNEGKAWLINSDLTFTY